MSHSAYRWGWPLAGVVSVVLASGVGCSAADPCEGESQTCLTIQVETPGEAKSDLVRAVYSLNGGPKVQQGFAATENAASSFPIVFALPLGDGGNAQVDVIAELLATPTLRGTINETLAAADGAGTGPAARRCGAAGRVARRLALGAGGRGACQRAARTGAGSGRKCFAFCSD